MWSVFAVEPGRLGGRPRGAGGRGRAARSPSSAGKDVVRARRLRRRRAAGRRRPHGVVARAETSRRCRPPTAGCGGPRWAGTCGRCGRSAALHRPAEFNKSHVPAFLAGEEPRGYVCVYPFVRSYEWYLLPDDERRAHARRARAGWRASTRRAGQHGARRSRWATTSGSSRSRPTSCTASSTSCATCGPREARRHVREEVPFYTGPRRPLAELVATCREPPCA